jgi:uncharacterized membrane protein YphA (DoxX/SURF4 family)/thiol-disulfide isomerase/thioredoxin
VATSQTVGTVTEQSFLWKRRIAAISAILLGIVFLVSGAWKVFQPFQSGEVLEQAKVPAGMGVLGASTLGTIELFAAFLLFVPRFRRLGGLLGSALIVFFMCWIGYYYPSLVGHECSCFPIIKRTVGPGFFVGDAVFLIWGLLAYAWSPRAINWRAPAVAFMALVVLAGASFGVNAAERRNVQVPTPVMVDGKAADLARGKVFLYFYNPECEHCLAAARFMSKMHWTNTKVVGIPTNDPQFAKDFMDDSHFHVATSSDLAKLRKAFPFVDPPFGVALVDGEVKQTFNQAQFNEPSPKADLEKLTFVE